MVQKLSYALAILVLAACGNPIGVRFDTSVPGVQKSLMEGDLRALGSVQLAGANANDLAYLGISQATPAAISDYLQRRVRYVVGETFDYENNPQIAKNYYSGGTTTYYAESLSPTQLSESKTVMLNLGSYLYLDGKQNRYQYTMSLADIVMRVFTPRVGVVQIGEGLFTVNRISQLELDDKANSILRLATLIHEGRHSDGNGSNAGFPHTQCPSSVSRYKGQYACENNVNGPYAVQSIFLRLAIQGCTDCTSTQRTGLSLSLADYASRQVGYQYPDPTPEAQQ